MAAFGVTNSTKEFELYSMKIDRTILNQRNKRPLSSPYKYTSKGSSPGMYTKFKKISVRLIHNDPYHYSPSTLNSHNYNNNNLFINNNNKFVEPRNNYNYNSKFNTLSNTNSVHYIVRGEGMYHLNGSSAHIVSFTSPRSFNRTPKYKTKKSFTSRYALRRTESPQVVQKIRINKYKLINRRISNGSSVKRRSRSNGSVLSSSFSKNSYGSPKVLMKCRVASRLINRSWRCLRTRKSNKYCIFYNKFGRCHKGAKCLDIHDPERVSICTRFLRGTCTVKNCPFSHNLTKDKMPTCIYFLKGSCSKADCPYNHVYVGESAEICKEFLAGHCPMGEQCKRKHILVCPDFSCTGSCPLADKCPMRHIPKKKPKRLSANKNPANFTSLSKDKTCDKDDCDAFEAPSFIALAGSNESSICEAVDDSGDNFLFANLTDFSIIPKLN